ncbi:hypothetical protein ZHAS_00019777 [Anopheles sinensis]|uniref:Uncharacterized protein n=1 Tax=Anopheles sinensis TaxID=74873 RepID=A0A084WN97_ANOSI|nr:hypothetical protein ZHAS_00019777 [Anopheles sinensis]
MELNGNRCPAVWGVGEANLVQIPALIPVPNVAHPILCPSSRQTGIGGNNLGCRRGQQWLPFAGGTCTTCLLDIHHGRSHPNQRQQRRRSARVHD